MTSNPDEAAFSKIIDHLYYAFYPEGGCTKEYRRLEGNKFELSNEDEALKLLEEYLEEAAKPENNWDLNYYGTDLNQDKNGPLLKSICLSMTRSIGFKKKCLELILDKGGPEIFICPYPKPETYDPNISSDYDLDYRPSLIKQVLYGVYRTEHALEASKSKDKKSPMKGFPGHSLDLEQEITNEEVVLDLVKFLWEDCRVGYTNDGGNRVVTDGKSGLAHALRNGQFEVGKYLIENCGAIVGSEEEEVIMGSEKLKANEEALAWFQEKMGISEL